MNDGADVSSHFYFYGDNIRSVLNKNLISPGVIGIIPRLNFKLTFQLLQNIIFSQRTFEPIIALQEHSTVVNSRHSFKQFSIKYKKLEAVKSVESRRRAFQL